MFDQIVDQVFGNVFGQGFDQGFGGENKKHINTVYSTTRPKEKPVKTKKRANTPKTLKPPRPFERPFNSF